jgi:hypothetical protein
MEVALAREKVIRARVRGGAASYIGASVHVAIGRNPAF